MPSASAGRARRAATALGCLLVVCLPLTFLPPVLLVPLATPAAAATTRVTVSASDTAVLNLMNSERKAHGLGPLRMNLDLVSCAQRHDEYMAKDDTLSHQLPGEPSLGTRLSDAGYHWSSAGENIAWSTQQDTQGALALQTAMYDETPPNDGHRLNILSTHFRDVGIDVLIDTTHHKLWLTEDFGAPS